MLNTVEEGLEDIRQGKVLIVVDDEDRETKAILSFQEKRLLLKL